MNTICIFIYIITKVSCLTTIFGQKIVTYDKKKYGLMVSKQIDDVTSVAFFTGNIPHNLLQWNRHFELLYFCFENRIMQNINPLRPKRGSQWEYCEKYLSENITFNPCCHAVERWICFGNFKLFIQTQITFSFGCVERCEFSYCYPGDFWSETVAFYCPVFFS